MRQRDDRVQPTAFGRFGPLSRRELVRRTGLTGAALVGTPLLASMRVKSTFAQDIPRATSSATVDGKLEVLQDQDFHPDHNAFLRAEIEAYCQHNNWDYEITDVAGFQGGGDLNQLLVASVEAGDAPDLLIKDHQVRQLHFLGVLEPTTDLTEEMIGLFGEVQPAMTQDTFFEDQWWGVPFFTRAGGYYIRTEILSEAGIDMGEGLATLDQRREAALAMSNPDEQIWGWGITANRSGDGRATVWAALFSFGSTLQDETGELVTFNSPESVDALEWLAETYSAEQWAPMLPPGIGTWTDTSNNEAFLAGTLAMTQNAGTMYAKAVLEKVPFAQTIAWQYTPVRNSDGATLDRMGGTKFHIIKDTKNKEASYDLIRHLLTEPVQQRLWQTSTSYVLPAYRNGWSHELIQGVDNSARAEPYVWSESGFTGLRWPGPASPAVDSVAGGNDHTDMVAELLQGRSAAEVVEDYHERFVQSWQDFGLKGE